MKRSSWTPVMNKLLLIVVGLFFYTGSFAQGNPGTEDLMRSNGKIYVVMAVVIVIVLGLFLYLVNLDRKISKIEKNSKP